MLLSHPQATFFHTAAWAKVLKSAYGYEPNYLCQPNGDQLRMLLPVMEVASAWTGCRGISLPFTDECQPLISERIDSHAILQEIIEHGQRRRWRYFECRGGRNHFEEASPSIFYYRHTLDLAKGEGPLFSNLDGAVRRAIRKAEKSRIEIERSQNVEAVRAFYALHQKTRHKHGLPPQPFTFFQSIQEHVLARNLGFVLLAKYEKIPIASAVFFHFGRKAIYKFGASDPKFLHLRGNNLVMWKAIQWYAQNGFRELSMGRTEMSNEGLRAFKQGWGTKEEVFDYWRFDLAKGRFVTTPDEVRGWHNQLFRVMPGWASRWAGTLLYRHIA